MNLAILSTLLLVGFICFSQSTAISDSEFVSKMANHFFRKRSSADLRILHHSSKEKNNLQRQLYLASLMDKLKGKRAEELPMELTEVSDVNGQDTLPENIPEMADYKRDVGGSIGRNVMYSILYGLFDNAQENHPSPNKSW